MQITLPEDVEALIRSRANVAGFEKVEDYVLSLLTAEAPLQTVPRMPYEQWHREFFSLVASFQPGHPHVDDSRESIYPDR